MMQKCIKFFFFTLGGDPPDWLLTEFSIIGGGGEGQPDDGKFHHIFTFFNPSLSIIQQRNILIFLLEALIIDIKGSP